MDSEKPSSEGSLKMAGSCLVSPINQSRHIVYLAIYHLIFLHNLKFYAFFYTLDEITKY